jgi:hypothetical protein
VCSKATHAAKRPALPPGINLKDGSTFRALSGNSSALIATLGKGGTWRERIPAVDARFVRIVGWFGAALPTANVLAFGLAEPVESLVEAFSRQCLLAHSAGFQRLHALSIISKKLYQGFEYQVLVGVLTMNRIFAHVTTDEGTGTDG